MFCDGCDSRMQRQTLIRFAHGRAVTTHCWYCWDCKANRHVVPMRQSLSDLVRPRGWRSWFGGRHSQPMAA